MKKMKKMKSRNQTFQWLEALAIIMVIDDHVSTRVGILSSVFPYNSFYMPMLVFISGYFFKDRRLGEGIQHKALHLLVPYIIWSLAGDALSYILYRCGIVNWFSSPFQSPYNPEPSFLRASVFHYWGGMVCDNALLG